MIASMADALTVGLIVANEAIGNIKQYHLVIGTVKLMALPLSIVIAYLGYGPLFIAISYVSVEFISSILRIYFLHKTGGLNINEFIKNVFFREIIPVVVSLSICFCCLRFINSDWRFLLTFSLSIVFYTIAIFITGLTQQERKMINSIFFKHK